MNQVTDQKIEEIKTRYNGRNLKVLMADLQLTEHYVKKIARESGVILKRRPLKPFKEQLAQYHFSVKRKHLKEAIAEILPIIEKYRK